MTTFTSYHVATAEGKSEHMTLEAATMRFNHVSGPATLTADIYKNNICDPCCSGYTLVSSETLRKK